MSDYRREQLLTYAGGPFLVLVGLALFTLNFLLFGHRGRPAAIDAVVCVIGVYHCIYGVYVIRKGRRRLADDHWRAEHFIP